MSSTIVLKHEEIKNIVDSDEPVSQGSWQWVTSDFFTIAKYKVL